MYYMLKRKEEIMNKELIVEIKSRYGIDYTYPICDTSKKLCSITPHKTFSVFAIRQLKELGYTFKQKERVI